MACFDIEGSDLIFLASLPNGGGAMFREMLSDHGDVHAPIEPCVVLLPLLAIAKGRGVEHGLPWMLAALDNFINGLPAGEPDYLDAVRAMASVLYGRSLAGSGKRVFLDSTARNCFAVSELRRVFPKARFVLLVRNPIAALLSALVNSFDADVDAFRNSKCYGEIILGVSHMQAAIASMGESATVIRFEDLQSGSDEILKWVCCRLGLTHDRTVGDPLRTSHCRSDRTLAAIIERETGSRLHTLLNFAQDELKKMGPDLVGVLGYDYEKICEDIGRLEPPNVTSEESSPAELNKHGEEHFEAGDHEGARRLFERALEMDPRNGDAMNNLAIIHAVRGEIRESLELLAEVLRIDPGHREAAENYAAIAAASETPVETDFDAVANVDGSPTCPRDECLPDEGSTPATTAKKLNRLGEELFSRGDSEGAMTCFLEAHEHAPDDATVCNNLGVLFARMGRTKEALFHAEHAVELDPCNATFACNAVKLLIESGSVREALAICAIHRQDCVGETVQQVADGLDLRVDHGLLVPGIKNARSNR